MKDKQEFSGRKLIDRLVPESSWGAMRGLLATSYELQPEFLETDFLPSVFGLGAWDDRSWTSRIAIEKRLFEAGTAVILSEARRYRGRPRSLRLEVRPIVVQHGSSFHAKVTLLLFENAVRLIVGSANLTEQGYRRNREIVAVLTATPRSHVEATLIEEALTGMEAALAPWLPLDARKLIEQAQDTLKPWKGGATSADTSFVWSNGQTRLWREYLNRWPADEVVRRLSIVSPFWSNDANGTIAFFLTELKKTGRLAPGAELRLFTDAHASPDGGCRPILPPGFATFDWASLGVSAVARAVSPEVYPEEVGGMEDFAGSRALHAKVVLMEGPKTGLAYLGSGNFTARGWGFLPAGGPANLEAGLILKKPLSPRLFDSWLPETSGQAVSLQDGNIQSLQAPESSPEDDPWPDFVLNVVLAPASDDDSKLELRIDVAADSALRLWSARLPEKEGISPETLVSVDDPQYEVATSFRIPLSAHSVTRLLIEQEILICWSECTLGRLVPLNVESSARALLPISPTSKRIQETDLVSYYQGKIAWEDLFPDPDNGTGQGGNAPQAAVINTSVDKSQIQSYQIREFVEALTGLRQDLRAATQSEPCMRMALLGPVSPVALARAVFEAARSGVRTPTGAAFQFVEILACLNTARTFLVQERLSEAWHRHIDDSSDKTDALFQQLCSTHATELSQNREFGRYRKAILGTKPEMAK